MNIEQNVNTPPFNPPTTQEIITQLEQALRDERPDNAHLRRVLAWAEHGPTAARTVELLSNRSGELLRAIDAEGHLIHYGLDGIHARTPVGALLTEQDAAALPGVFECVTYKYAFFWPWEDGQMPDLVTAEAVNVVRAAYVLCVDLTSVEFDQEPDLHDDDELYDDDDNDGEWARSRTLTN